MNMIKTLIYNYCSQPLFLKLVIVWNNNLYVLCYLVFYFGISNKSDVNANFYINIKSEILKCLKARNKKKALVIFILFFFTSTNVAFFFSLLYCRYFIRVYIFIYLFFLILLILIKSIYFYIFQVDQYIQGCSLNELHKISIFHFNLVPCYFLLYFSVLESWNERDVNKGNFLVTALKKMMKEKKNMNETVSDFY